MSRFSKYVREKVVKVLVAALVAGSVAGNEGITVQAAGADLNDPFSFVLYTNEFVSSNLDHIEGNAAIRELKVSMVSYGENLIWEIFLLRIRFLNIQRQAEQTKRN